MDMNLIPYDQPRSTGNMRIRIPARTWNVCSRRRFCICSVANGRAGSASSPQL